MHVAKKVPILPDGGASAAYDAECRRCSRLAAFLDAVQGEHPDYFCRPVPPFGAARAALVVVGLAPGKHGANASGRPFTGDHAGILLYATLHAYGAGVWTRDGARQLRMARALASGQVLSTTTVPVAAWSCRSAACATRATAAKRASRLCTASPR